MRYYIGIDLGGTNIAAGLVDENGILLKKCSRPTGSGRQASAIIDDMAEAAIEAAGLYGLSMEDITSLGVGVPGTANRETGCVEYANNLGFYDEPLVPMLEKRFPGKKIIFDNDASAAAWGEYLAVNEGCRSMVMVTLGTGIGGGIIFDGKIYDGTNYAAGEFGHMVIDINGIPCNCGRKGCFECYASATALVAQTRTAMMANGNSLLWELCGGKSELVEGKTLFEAVERKDETAIEVLKQYTYYLGVGLINIINAFQPEILCIGGGISKAGDILLLPLQKMIDRESYTRNSKNQTKVRIAVLDNDAGLIGAALLK